MPKISIVTPVYNASKYVGETYVSLLQQSFSDWQWTAVDDGSTDGSGDILDAIAKDDKRVKVIHQSNSGSAKFPRDRAVYESDGELILMLDADDTIDRDYLLTMLQRMDETKADIVYPVMLFEKEGKCVSKLPVDSVDMGKVFRGRDMVRMTIPDWKIGCNGGLYRRHVWVNMSYPHYDGKIVMNTDELDERLYQLKAETVAFAKTCYHYRLHPASITKRGGRNCIDILQTDCQLLRIIDKEFGKESHEHRFMKQKIKSDIKNALFVFYSILKNLFNVKTLVNIHK